tara:strand:- start:13 stop:267 length:255 start_codon:yes stop_codon:yes gene_type:complete
MKYEDAPRVVEIPADPNSYSRDPSYSIIEGGDFWRASNGRRLGHKKREQAQEAILKGLLVRADKKAARAANLLSLLARSYRERR